MREVVIIGVGLHKFGRFPEKTVREMGREAIENALEDSGVPFKDVEVAYMGHVYQPMGTGSAAPGGGGGDAASDRPSSGCGMSTLSPQRGHFALLPALPPGAFSTLRQPGHSNRITCITIPVAGAARAAGSGGSIRRYGVRGKPPPSPHPLRRTVTL